jgi:hypothetical protein
MFSSSTLNHFNGYIMLWPVSGSIVRLADFSIRVLIKDIMKNPVLWIRQYSLDMSRILVTSIP